MNIEKRCNHFRLIVACMLSGASRDRPVIVGWSTAHRGRVINESLGQLAKKLAAAPCVLARTESSRTQAGTKQGGPPHDHWAKLGQCRYTRSQHPFVVIALFSNAMPRRASIFFSYSRMVVRTDAQRTSPDANPARSARSNRDGLATPNGMLSPRP